MNDESERQKLKAYKSFVRCLSKIDINKKIIWKESSLVEWLDHDRLDGSEDPSRPGTLERRHEVPERFGVAIDELLIKHSH